jgi:hypothetical protein
MSVLAADMKLRYTTASGAAGLTTAGTRDTSLGKYASTTDVTAPPNAFFDDVQSAEASAGDTEYRCIIVYNSHATDSALNVVVKLTGEVAGGGATTTALDNIATAAANGASALSATVANENTAPTGVGTFDTSDKTIGTLAAGQGKAFWLKRTVGAATGPLVGDGFTITVGGDG